MEDHDAPVLGRTGVQHAQGIGDRNETEFDDRSHGHETVGVVPPLGVVRQSRRPLLTPFIEYRYGFQSVLVRLFPEIDEPVNRRDHQRSTDDVSGSNRNQISWKIAPG